MSLDLKNFDEFIIESVIGEGGMGKVYRARQVALDRWVALKILPNAREDSAFIERFYREARSAAKLVHPNIIQIYTVGEHQGIPYFTMEYIEGADLERLLRGGDEPFSVDEMVEVVRSVGKALGVAAEQGIVHRDIKPANIMVTKTGLVKVMDFGLAKGAAAIEETGQINAVIGTPAYMSPEQGSAKPVDTRSDFYSLGCVLYELLCGRQPFSAETVAALIYKHTYDKPEPPHAIRPGAHPELERVCLKLMAKDPAERYQKDADLLAALALVPANLGAAEVALTRRVGTALLRKKARDAGRKSGITPVVMRPKGPVSARPSARQGRVLATALPGRPPPGPPSTAVRTDLTPQATAVLENALLKLSDGRWTYRWENGACKLAEGLAASLPLPEGQKGRLLADCFLCGNWGAHFGCALGRIQELQKNAKASGVRALADQAEAWMQTPNYHRGIALLDAYVKHNPQEPEGYRELARCYERPEYKERDKRRAIVLYQRFAELARLGGFASVEIQRAEEHAAQLKVSLPAGNKSGTRLTAHSRVPVQCFYWGSSGCLAFGWADARQVLLARAGELDPETGKHAAELGGAMVRASTIFRRFRTEKARQDEAAGVRTELERLSDLSPEGLLADAAFLLTIRLDEVQGFSVETRENWSYLTLRTARQAHALIFTPSGAFQAEQCQEILRRKVH